MKSDIKKRAKHRINIIKGQLDGILKMIEEETYCMDILNQTLSVQNSLRSLDALILSRHLRIHIKSLFEKNPEKAVKELMHIFKRVPAADMN